jgi:hypothetical protein
VKIIHALPLMVIVTLLLIGKPAWGQEGRIKVLPQWKEIIGVSKANVSIQVCPEPPMRRGHPIHDQLFKALRYLGADYPRLQPWFPYPKMSVAELRAPEHGRTFWDFTLMDQITEDFMQATTGHPVVFDFGTVPAWMYKTEKPTPYPENPDEITWSYARARNVTDSTINQVAEYQQRLANWYLKAGFIDEAGVRHESGHHYKVDYWEVLNEPDGEHFLSPADYVRFYDAIVEAVRQVAPEMKFAGPALADSLDGSEYMEYFLNPRNHKPGIPIDMITYHFYAIPDADEPDEVRPYAMFHQADLLLTAAHYVNGIRRRYTPQAKVDIDELGTMLPDQMVAMPTRPIPKNYWMMSGSVWAYIYGHAAGLDVDVLGGAELIDYPTQNPSLTLVDWDSGKPNTRYWVVKLLRDNFGPGDQIVKTTFGATSVPTNPLAGASAAPDSSESLTPTGNIYGQAFIAAKGQRRLLLVNKRDRAVDVAVPGAVAGTQQSVEESTTTPPAGQPLSTDMVHLPPFAVAVVTFRQ